MMTWKMWIFKRLCNNIIWNLENKKKKNKSFYFIILCIDIDLSKTAGLNFFDKNMAGLN